MGILDYFTPEARRGNREWLDSQNAAISEALRYYLGPTGIPERLGLLAESTPTAGLERAGTESSRMFAPGLSGWDRMAAAGNMLSETAGAGAGLLGIPPAGRAVGDVVEAAAPAVRQFGVGDEGGLKLYHGSPHSFDKFSMDKIGTGEGAQAYGHGLYFAGNEGVAKGYRDTLSQRPVKLIGDRVARENDPSDAAALLMHEYGGDVEKARQHIFDAARDASTPDDHRLVHDTLAALNGNVPKITERFGPGSMYEVQINADPEAFLDWDKPLSEQPQIAQDMARTADLSHLPPGNRTRRQIEMWRDGTLPNEASAPDFNALRNALTGYGGDASQNVAFTNKLREAGIPGIKYLDAGSRGNADVNELRGTVSMWTTAVNKTPNDDYAWKMLEDAENALKQAEAGSSRNYVIFDENLISIVRKYGIAGAAAMLGMSQADVAQAMGQQPQGLLESGPQ